MSADQVDPAVGQSIAQKVAVGRFVVDEPSARREFHDGTLDETFDVPHLVVGLIQFQ